MLKRAVSVVIPHYENTDTVDRAIASVEAQTAPAAEIIVIDDHSSEQAWNLLVTICENRRSPVKILRTSINSGVSTARNIGWAEAKSEFVAFLDADDTWEKDKLRLQMLLMNEYDMVAGQLTNGNRHQRIRRQKPCCVRRVTNLTWRNPIATSTVLLRRSIEQRFDPLFRFSQDYDLWLRMIAAGHRTGVLNVPLARNYKYIFGDGGNSGNLWLMERGQLAALVGMRRRGDWSSARWVAATCWSLIKHLRRVVLTAIRRYSLRMNLEW